MMYNFFFALILICFSSSQILGQEVLEDVIYLENGTVLRGQVLEYDPKGEIKIEIAGGSILVYKSSTVLKMEKEKSTATFKEGKKQRSLNMKDKGWYHSLSFGHVIETNNPMGFHPFSLIGLSLEYSVGYQFHRLFGLGLNVGFLGSGADAGFPICANFRGYFMDKSASLYYDLNIGYGLSINSFTTLRGRDNGGLHIHPSIGVRFASTRKGRTTLALGYLIQTGRTTGFSSELSTLLAITMRIGVTF